jgi:ABC-type Mn2+/Zn2+ transport system ATPase subunit
VIASTHDLLCAAQRFHQAALINGRLIAHGPANLVLDQQLLAQTYGGHVLILAGGDGHAVALDDAHHHDQPPGREQHFHDKG